MLKKTIARLVALAVVLVGSLAITGQAHASGSECGLENVGGSQFRLCTYVNNDGGDGLYINYANVYLDTSLAYWTFPTGLNCTVQPALTLWYSNGFSTVTGPTYSCAAFQGNPSYTFGLHKEQPANENEVCATLFFSPYNQRVGYNDDCVGVHR
jgi:hypothetical protein